MKNQFASALFVIAGISASNGIAQQVFFDDFDVDHSSNWNINLGAGNNAANIFFDYSTIGIPTAPNSVGGSTRGVKLEANFGPTAALSGVSVSPVNGSFLGDYTIRFDMWINYNGPLAAGGSGSTHMTTAGIGTTGLVPIHGGSLGGAAWFAVTGDGGNGDSPGDYRAYANGAVLAPASGAYYAGTGAGARNDTVTYYNPLGSRTAPAAQIGLFPQQTGTTRPGAAGMDWKVVTITKTNGWLNWNISGLDIARFDVSALTLSTNFFLGHSDINSTVSTDANRRDLSFGLIDNVVVTLVPEPSTIAIALLGGAGVCWAMRRRRG